MSTSKELNEAYKKIYNKNFPQATLSRWVKEGKIRVNKKNSRVFDYNLEDFLQIIQSKEYQTKSLALKEKPQDYIGRIKGHLLIKGIVPKNEYNSNYNGTLMYCDCLACGKKNVQVRFTYLSDNGNYDQLTCGCGRKIRAFLASARNGITEEFLYSFNDFEKFLFIHKMLTHITDNYYGTNCDLEEYQNAVRYFYNNEQFNKIYEFWLLLENEKNTFYDLSKPSLDHIVPLSKGGTSKLENLQVLTVFENLAKRDMTMEEWESFKKQTHSTSDYYLDSILQKGGDANV